MPSPSGAPIAPTVTQAAIAGTTPGVYTFAQPVHVWQIYNGSGQIAYCKFHGTVADPASTSDWDFLIASGASYSGAIPVGRFSIWFPATATVQLTDRTSATGTGTATVSIFGWPNAGNTDPLA